MVTNNREESVFISRNKKWIPWIFGALAVAFLLLLIIDRHAYSRLLDEDGPVEWLTAIFLFFAGIVFGIAAIKQATKFRIFYGVFALALILGALEEISWGQRIFEVESPDFFQKHSDQQEINIHNTFQELTEIKTKHLVGIFMLLYGFLVPYYYRKGKLKLPKLLTDYIPLPPEFLYIPFLIGALFMADMPTMKEEEVGEMLLSFCLLLFGLYQKNAADRPSRSYSFTGSQ